MHDCTDYRAIAVALPAKNEEQELPACLAALDVAADRYPGPVTVMVLANDCTDATIGIVQQTRLKHAHLKWAAVSLLDGARHAGWARRLAFDAAEAVLRHDADILASTDADTCVDPDWIVRSVAHFDAGIDAVAGRAFTRRTSRAALGCEAAKRLNQLGRYYTALDWLRADLNPVCHDPWPRHYFEGGASIALTRAIYRGIGGAPTPPVAEDRALFSAVREAGGRVRHPLDVRVFTSCRIEGRAAGGMADAYANWIAQAEDAPLHETYAFPAALDPLSARGRDRLSFATLPDAINAAAAVIRTRRSAAAPQVEPILVPTLLPLNGDRGSKQSTQLVDGCVT